MTKNLLFLLPLFYLLGCSKQVSDVKVYHVSSSVEQKKDSTYRLCDLQEEIGPLGRGLSDVEFLTDTTFVVAAERNTYIYHINGEQLKQIGSIGKGPQEYMHACDLHVSNGKLYLFCFQLKKVLVFDSNGDFLTEYKGINVLSSKMVVVEDKYIYFYRRTGVLNEPSIQVYDISTKQVIAKYGSLTKIDQILMYRPIAGAIFADQEGVFYANPSSLSVRKIKDGIDEELFIIDDDSFDVDTIWGQKINKKDIQQALDFLFKNSVVQEIAVDDSKIYLGAEIGEESLNQHGESSRESVLYLIDQKRGEVEKIALGKTIKLCLLNEKVRYISSDQATGIFSLYEVEYE